ncbi:hypothetical protein Tco_1314262 [Tanacetum coccineum]
MAGTMEQYMSKTRANYGSGIARPKIEDKDSFELKGQFLKELCDNTFSGLDHEYSNEHIEKVLEIVDLFHIIIHEIHKLTKMIRRSGRIKQIESHIISERKGKMCVFLKTKFLSKYCPPARTAKKMEEINNFHKYRMKTSIKLGSDLKKS